MDGKTENIRPLYLRLGSDTDVKLTTTAKRKSVMQQIHFKMNVVELAVETGGGPREK